MGKYKGYISGNGPSASNSSHVLLCVLQRSSLTTTKTVNRRAQLTEHRVFFKHTCISGECDAVITEKSKMLQIKYLV